MFSRIPDSESKSNSQNKILLQKSKKEEKQELNDRALAEAKALEFIDTNIEEFDKKPVHNQGFQNQSSDKELTNMRGIRTMPVPQYQTKLPALKNVADQYTVPPELRGITLEYLDGDIVGETKEHSFTPASAKKFTFFNQTDLPITAFLNYVVRGYLEESKSMLEKDPSLVLYKGQVTDFSGRTIEGTAYKIALGAEDVSREAHPDEGMADMIRGYFIKALNGDEKLANKEIKKQFEEQFPKNEFPEYYEANKKKKAEIIMRKIAADPDIKELEKVIQAILHADEKEIIATRTGKKDPYGNDEYELKVTGECAKALQAFRNYLKPQGVIKKGKHFNMLLLGIALEKYCELYNVFGGHGEDPKNLLLWRQVIGYIERYLPANLAQAFCHGLGHVSDETGPGKSLKRSLKLQPKLFFYPIDLSSKSGLGFDYSVYSTFVIGFASGAENYLNSMLLGINNLYQAKTAVLSLPRQRVKKTVKKSASCGIQ